jgi:hypothetical protein
MFREIRFRLGRIPLEVALDHRRHVDFKYGLWPMYSQEDPLARIDPANVAVEP